MSRWAAFGLAQGASIVGADQAINFFNETDDCALKHMTVGCAFGPAGATGRLGCVRGPGPDAKQPGLRIGAEPEAISLRPARQSVISRSIGVAASRSESRCDAGSSRSRNRRDKRRRRRGRHLLGQARVRGRRPGPSRPNRHGTRRENRRHRTHGPQRREWLRCQAPQPLPVQNIILRNMILSPFTKTFAIRKRAAERSISILSIKFRQHSPRCVPAKRTSSTFCGRFIQTHLRTIIANPSPSFSPALRGGEDVVARLSGSREGGGSAWIISIAGAAPVAN